jgi:hypothetical protein
MSNQDSGIRSRGRQSSSFVRTVSAAISILAVGSLAAQPACAPRAVQARYASSAAPPQAADGSPTRSDDGPASQGPQVDDARDRDRTDSTSDASRGARDVGWISLSIGVEAAIVAIVTSGMILDSKSTRDSHCNAQKVCSQDGLDANSSIQSLLGWNAAAWAVAVVGTGAGIILVATHPYEAKPVAALTLAPAAAGAALRLEGSF